MVGALNHTFNHEEEVTEEKTRIIYVKRIKETANSTISTFVTDDNSVSGYMLEPAGPSTTESGLDRRIPAGTYDLSPHSSKKFPNSFELTNDDVPSSRHILIHSGNYPIDTHGCLLPGNTMGIDYVGGSKITTNTLYKYINNHISNGGVQVIISDIK